MKPGFVSDPHQSYRYYASDGIDTTPLFHQFRIDPDVDGPVVSFREAPSGSSFALNYIFKFEVADNVWPTFNVKTYRNNVLISQTLGTTSNFDLITNLVPGANDLDFIFSDAVGNETILIHTIQVNNAYFFDPINKIYCELPVGAYELPDGIKFKQ